MKARLTDVERLKQEAKPPTPQPSRATRTADAVPHDAKNVIAPRRRTLSRVDLPGAVATAAARARRSRPHPRLSK